MTLPVRTGLRLALAVLVLAAVGGAAAASTFIRMDIDSLSIESEMVVQARVLGGSSTWNADHSMIFTHVQLQIARVLKGTAPARITVRVPGGTVDGMTTVMAGAPRFEQGSEVVAFLARWDDGPLAVMGYAQGLSRIVRDGAGHARLEGGAAHSLTLAELAGHLAGRRAQEEGR